MDLEGAVLRLGRGAFVVWSSPVAVEERVGVSWTCPEEVARKMIVEVSGPSLPLAVDLMACCQR